MVEAAGVEPASETPSSHEIRRLPSDPPAGVVLSFQISQPRDVHHPGVTRQTLLCWRIQNVFERGESLSLSNTGAHEVPRLPHLGYCPSGEVVVVVGN